MQRNQVARGRTLVAKGKGPPLEVGDRLDAGLGVRHHDREVLRLAVVQDGRHRLRASVVVGQHVAPRPHQRDVGLAVGERLGQPLPAIDSAQLHRALERTREVIGQRPVGGVVLVLVGLEQAHPQAQRLGRGGSRNRGRHGEAGDYNNEKMGKTSHGGTLRGCALFDMQTAGSSARLETRSDEQSISYTEGEHASLFSCKAPQALPMSVRVLRRLAQSAPSLLSAYQDRRNTPDDVAHHLFAYPGRFFSEQSTWIAYTPTILGVFAWRVVLSPPPSPPIRSSQRPTRSGWPFVQLAPPAG